MTKTIKPKAPAADFWDGVDPEIAEFERGLLESIGQMKRGEVGRMHTPEMIAGYRTRGRPVGSVKAEAKQAVTVRYSPEVLASFTLMRTMLLPGRSAVLGCLRWLQRLSCE